MLFNQVQKIGMSFILTQMKENKQKKYFKSILINKTWIKLDIVSNPM